jgi:hypothetical protein
MPTTNHPNQFTMKKQSLSSSPLCDWLHEESKSFSILCGESFTRAEVIAANAVTIAMLTVAVVAGSALGC